jgi:hypothetical protein
MHYCSWHTCCGLRKKKTKVLILVPNLLLQLAHVLRPVLVKRFEYLYEALDTGAEAYILVEGEMETWNYRYCTQFSCVTSTKLQHQKKRDVEVQVLSLLAVHTSCCSSVAALLQLCCSSVCGGTGTQFACCTSTKQVN